MVEPLTDETIDELKGSIVAILKTVYDPEIPVDIYEMGLIYQVDLRDGGNVYVRMTLTSPMCPVAETLPPEVEMVTQERAYTSPIWYTPAN